MFRDSQTALYEGVALSATGVSTNGYDCGAPGVTSGEATDISQGKPMVVCLTVGVAAKVSGTTETYEFDVIQADDAALTSNVVTLAQYPFTNAQAAALLKAGAIIVLPIPQGSITQRYVGIKFIGANTPTITVTAWITWADMVQQQSYYSTKIAVL